MPATLTSNLFPYSANMLRTVHAAPLQSPPCRSLSWVTEIWPDATSPATLALPLSTQAAYAQAAGAAAVLVVNDDDTGFFRMGQEPTYTGAAVAVPVGGMSQVH